MATKLDACQVAAVRVDTPWTTRGGVVACVASLSRPLSRRETRKMELFPEFSVTGDRVAYDCRPEESEAFEKRLSAVLRSLLAPAATERRRTRPRGGNAGNGVKSVKSVKRKSAA